MSKPVAYLLDRSLQLHALVLAMRTVVSRKSARPRNVDKPPAPVQLRLPIEVKP